MSKFTALTKTVVKTLSDHSPAILTGVAVSGAISTTVLMYRAVNQARDILDEEELYTQPGTTNIMRVSLSNREKFAKTWQCYIPPAGTLILTATSILGAQAINSKRLAAIGALYSVTETAFQEYKDKVVESVNAAQNQKVNDEIIKDRMQSSPAEKSEVVIIGTGTVLCYDSFTDRYFMSDMETIRRAVNDINLTCINDQYASLNDFYDKIGLGKSTVGEDLGWTVSDPLEVIFSPVMSSDGRPCIGISFQELPKKDYYKLW